MSEEARIVVRPTAGAASHAMAVTQLSTMDQFMVNWTMTVFYSFAAPPSGQEPFNIDRLKSAFQKTIDVYPYIAGTLNKSTSSIDISGELKGALIVVSSSEKTLGDIHSPSWTQSSDMSTVTNDYFATDCDGHLLSMKCTILACGGLALGITASHALFDGNGCFMFVNQFSRAYRGAPLLPLQHDRTPMNPADNLPPTFTHPEYPDPAPPATAPATTATPGTMMVPDRKLFRYSASALKNLKALATPADGSYWVSTIDALQAHILILVTRARSMTRSIASKTILHNTGVNGRKRLDPPLQATYVGNVVFNALSEHQPSTLLDDSHANALRETASRIRNRVNAMTDAYIRDAIRFVASAAGGPAVGLRVNIMGDDFLVTSWAGMGLRDADMGHGRTYYAGPQGGGFGHGFAVFLDGDAETAGDADGIDVYLVLPKDVMNNFEKLWTQDWK